MSVGVITLGKYVTIIISVWGEGSLTPLSPRSPRNPGPNQPQHRRANPADIDRLIQVAANQQAEGGRDAGETRSRRGRRTNQRAGRPGPDRPDQHRPRPQPEYTAPLTASWDWAWVEALELDEFFMTLGGAARTSMRIRHNVIPRLAEIFTAILQQIYDWRADMNPNANLAHKLLIVAPALLFTPGIRGGSKSVARMQQRRVARFAAGEFQCWRRRRSGSMTFPTRGGQRDEPEHNIRGHHPRST